MAKYRREIDVYGTKTKTGNLAAPRFSAFRLPSRRFLSASGGTHRVRGVLLAVCVLSPVESSSPPWLFELQFRSTPLPYLWQEYFGNFKMIRGRFSPVFLCVLCALCGEGLL